MVSGVHGFIVPLTISYLHPLHMELQNWGRRVASGTCDFWLRRPEVKNPMNPLDYFPHPRRNGCVVFWNPKNGGVPFDVL